MTEWAISAESLFYPTQFSSIGNIGSSEPGSYGVVLFSRSEPLFSLFAQNVAAPKLAVPEEVVVFGPTAVPPAAQAVDPKCYGRRRSAVEK